MSWLGRYRRWRNRRREVVVCESPSGVITVPRATAVADVERLRAELRGPGRGLTDDPGDPRLTRGVDEGPVPQAPVYLVLSEAERAQGFVRPVRRRYQHTGCGSVTTMSLPIAETYARQPGFYGATYCVSCSRHVPVGECRWVDPATGAVTDQVVGS